MLDIDKLRKLTELDYPKKILGSPKKFENVVKMMVFRLFLKNGSNDFVETCSECRTNQFWAPRENHMSKKSRSQDIHPQSSDFGQKWWKWCPMIVLYLENGKYYQESDLIFGIYDKFPFLYVSPDFHLHVVFMEKIWLENDQFSCIVGGFWHFLTNHFY